MTHIVAWSRWHKLDPNYNRLKMIFQTYEGKFISEGHNSLNNQESMEYDVPARNVDVVKVMICESGARLEPLLQEVVNFFNPSGEL